MAKKQLSVKQTIIRELPYVVIRVLIKNRLLTAYLDNFDPDYFFDNGRTLAIFRKTNPAIAIMYGFIWNHTPEGIDVWSSIYNEIHKMYKR